MTYSNYPITSDDTVLVTGGGGFLGRATVELLLQKKAKVRITGRKTYPDLEKAGCEVFQGEISDKDLLLKATEGCTMVFHMAAKAGTEEPYSEFERINYKGTLAVIEACKKNGVKKLIYTSSPSVVFADGDIEGANESLPYLEDTKDSPYYPKTKRMAEKAVLAENSENLATTSLRPHLIWGPGDNNLLPRIESKARAGKMRFIGDGTNKVDTTYILNAATAHIQAAEALAPGSPNAGKAYFITNGEPMPLKDVVNSMLAAAGCGPVTSHIPVKVAYWMGALCEFVYKKGWFGLKGEQPLTRWVAGEMATAHWFDISAAKRDFGYEPIVSMKEGFKLLKEHCDARNKSNKS
ncbi:MAG: NAD-dependent epimerase/dehydratase family protein [Candidatus Riflebacteria bacterium]|nr:NAD-dependent epimerase/dehydratase family protein [Candidatus Riflebacteria bacterium]